MPRSPTPPTYAPLVAFLTALPATTTTVTLTLTEIEQLIGAPLPASASTQTWWTTARDRRRRLRPWLVAGWQVSGVAMRTAAPSVTFDRQQADQSDDAVGGTSP